jgi:peptide/nickel transport system permease protein
VIAVGKRLLYGATVIWLAATLAFIALRVLPGDALLSQLSQAGVEESAIQQQRAAAGLTDPIPVQYGRFWAGLLRGDFGTSLLSGQRVTEMIRQQLPPTLVLAVSALALAVVLGISLGYLGALDAAWGLPELARFLMNAALSTPIYWTGTLAIYVFTVQLDLLPSGGAGGVSQLVLPVLVLGFHTSGAVGRVVQASLRDVRSADYVRGARAKGLTETHIALHHVLRAGLLPVITVVALQAGFLLSGVVITESLFARPGLGKLLLDSTLRQDYPVVQGIVVLSAVVYTLLNTAADVVYALADPRVTV